MKMYMDAIKNSLQAYGQDSSENNLVSMLETLISSSVWIPVFEDNQPDILADMDGHKFYPVFSSQEEALDEYVQVKWQQLPFVECLHYVTENKKVHAIVVNPFTENVRLPKDIVEGLNEQFGRH